MTLALPDTTAALGAAAAQFASGRPLVLYGEDLEDKQVPPGAAELLAGHGTRAMRRILHTLQSGGVFCTYPDFVYDGHAAVTVDLFGRSRPMSGAFVAIAAQPGTYLLPCWLGRTPDGIQCDLLEPVVIADDAPAASAEGRQWRRAVVAQLIAGLLAQLINAAPHQWLLLATLTHDSPQLANPTPHRSVS